MKHILSAALVGVLFSATAMAQTSNSTMPPAVASGSGDSQTTAAPVPGKNSFTETEARDRLEKRGYTNVEDLVKDQNSIWRGRAIKDGKPVEISLDYQGNIVSE
jgi:hypothetical protein